MEKKFYYQNLEINYKISGKGQPVVLLHGFAEDSNIWNEQANFLQGYCQLIIPDLPGSGQSAMLLKDNATIEDYADVVNDLLVHENIDKCILLGHSMGGYITLAFANKYPDKLKAFGFIHSSAFADDEEKKESRQKSIQMMEKYSVFSFLKNTTPILFSEKYKKNHSEEISAFIEQGKTYSKSAMIQYYNAMMSRPDLTEVLKESSVPVLFIIGSEDKAAPLDDLLQQVHLPKVSCIHIIQDAGHMSMMEEPELLNKYLLQFIKNGG